MNIQREIRTETEGLSTIWNLVLQKETLLSSCASRAVGGMPLYPLVRMPSCRAVASGYQLIRDYGGAMMLRRGMCGGEVKYTVKKDGRRIAYEKTSGTTPNVLYISGVVVEGT